MNPKAAGALSMTLVFLCGTVVGAFGAHKWVHSSPPFWTAAGKEISVRKWTRELNLSQAQSQQIATILDDFSTYYRTVIGGAYSRITQILDDGQKRKFDQMLSAAGDKKK
jgi:hypothetical protein